MHLPVTREFRESPLSVGVVILSSTLMALIHEDCADHSRKNEATHQ